MNSIFFEEADNIIILRGFLRATEMYAQDTAINTRLSTAREIINAISISPHEWDERCSCNISWVGTRFIDLLKNFDKSKDESIDTIFCFSYRFLCEFDFMIGEGRELSVELQSIQNDVVGNLSKMEDSIRSKVIYISYMMPARIAKTFLNNKEVESFRDFNQKKAEAESLKKQWDEEIKEKKSELDKIREKLDEYKTAFNFVGLSKGFALLKEEKEKEASSLLRALLGMGFFMLVPLVLGVVFSFSGIYEAVWNLSQLMILLPVVSMEIVLVYFFRVLLYNHRSVKAQKMQIELRQTLCEFIQSYADYSVKIKKQDSSALEKFESLIFSGVLSDPQKLPSTFDGLDQLANFIKSVKGA